ncbi:MAG: glycoside hydrolase N-terminal domain-containing protein, partial [Cellulophaga baltica]
MKLKIALLLFWGVGLGTCFSQESKDLKLWYDAPASDWNEALPIGNGRLGAMVFGNPAHENIQLNENTLWAGGPHRNDNPKAKEALPKIRTLLFEGKYSEAHKLANEKFISETSAGMPYETVGNLRLNFPGHKTYDNYSRVLDLENAVNTITYTVDGVEFKRELFTSFTDQVLIIKLSASKKGKISFSATMDRPEPAKVNVYTENNNVLVMTGWSSDNKNKRLPAESPAIKGQVEFDARIKVIPEGGKVTSTNNQLVVSKANSVT